MPSKQKKSQPDEVSGHPRTVSNSGSAFAGEGEGLETAVDSLKKEIQSLYLEDDIPWIIGYSGGKDSTAVLQLTWLAISDLPSEKRTKLVHVITTDTMVENPIVASWVNRSLEVLGKQAEKKSLPFVPHRLTPTTENSFWVNLIGKGYPAPRHKFRWCTERLKIKPSNKFIIDTVKENGEAVLLLGARSAESSARAKVLKRHAEKRVRDRLAPNSTLPGCYVYTPIESWTNDDVWVFLMQIKNPWGYSNKDLLTMYSGATADGECPLVVDTTTPSCGDSRFGCWVCTLVEKDKSMTAMIQNDEEKEWMLPLLELRNALDFRTNEKGDRHLRDFRRLSGAVQLIGTTGDNVPGPYTQSSREMWLRKLLEAQSWIRKHGPGEVRDIELISPPELQEIRRMWIVDKHELEDRLPVIYREATGEDYPGRPIEDHGLLGAEEMEVLREHCGDDSLHYERVRDLLGVTIQQQTRAKRRGLYDALEKSIRRNFWDSRDQAVEEKIKRQSSNDDSKNAEPASRTPETSLQQGELLAGSDVIK